MAIFGTQIDYTKVRVHNKTAYFFQPSDTAITPNGEVYFPPTSYKGDFSTSPNNTAWLIHELTHVWQHQRGMWVRVRGALNRNYGYGDLKVSKRGFTSYSIEEQAAITEDYYRITHGLRAERGSGAVSDYERIIPFLPRTRR